MVLLTSCCAPLLFQALLDDDPSCYLIFVPMSFTKACWQSNFDFMKMMYNVYLPHAMDLSNQKKLVLKYFAFCTSDFFEISVCVYVTRIPAPLSCWIRYPRNGLLHSCMRFRVFFCPKSQIWPRRVVKSEILVVQPTSWNKNYRRLTLTSHSFILSSSPESSRLYCTRASPLFV